MKFKKLVLAALFAATTTFAGEPNTLTPEDQAAGWKLLFDGKTTKGWHPIGKPDAPIEGWIVEDGALKHVKGGGDLVTSEKFKDFELIWEWKISNAGNSGVKYNLQDPSRAIGFEYQMLDDINHPDGVKHGTIHQTAGLYDLISPDKDRKVLPVGEWNQSRLLVNGMHVEHWINGTKSVEFDMGSPDMLERIARSKYKKAPNFGAKATSPILLQDHGDVVFFRSMKLRELPQKP